MKVGREKLWLVRSARRPSLLLRTLRCDWIAVISSDSAAVIAISGPSHRETVTAGSSEEEEAEEHWQ